MAVVVVATTAIAPIHVLILASANRARCFDAESEARKPSPRPCHDEMSAFS
jgi:hypothetical protein